MAPQSYTIPAFEATAVEKISTDVETLRSTYRANRTKDIQYRLKQLRKLYWGIVDYAPFLAQALQKDLRKAEHESIMSEIDWCKMECMDLINNLEKWSKDESIVNVPVTFWAVKPRIRNEPLGVVLVIGAFNLPVQLSLVPLMGAMAAGNTVLLKPSENSPNCAMVMAKIVEEYLDSSSYRVVNGALPVSQELLEHKYDKICFTGGRGVGKIVAKKAAETLTPVLLELGGQNPAFVTKNANLPLTARRLVWSKTLNSGQVCISQNYALVERSVVTPFIDALKKAHKEAFPQGAKASPDLARIANKPSFDRLKKMLETTSGKIVIGGSMDESELFIEPTVVLVENTDDTMIIQESFGPIWSVVAVDSIDQAISIANEVDPTPLALYTFGSDAENEKVLRSVTSGGATCNDGLTHASVLQAPFGGVGNSGMGNYHGYYSFKAFSHQRTIAKVPGWMEKALRARYMPYSQTELKRFQAMMGSKPNFDREGNVTKGFGYWLGLVFSLGGKSAKSTVLRWGILLALAVSLGLKRSSVGL